MKLGKYLDELSINKAAFARKIGISTQFLHAIINGEKMPSLPVAIEIENATKGKVKPKDLISDKAPAEVQAVKKVRRPKSPPDSE